MRVLVVATALLVACARLAGAADVPITAVSDPPTIRATYQQTSQSGYVVISTTAKEGLPALHLRASTLAAGNAFATIGFSDNGGKETIDLPATTAPKHDVHIDITGLNAPGSYTGKIYITVDGQATGAVADIAVTRADPNFAPVVGGAAHKDGRITVTASDSSEPASITVQLPANSPNRKLEIVLGGKSLNSDMTATPQHFPAVPGEQKLVFLTLTDSMSRGTSAGSLTIRDAEHPDLALETFVLATKVRSTTGRFIILLVVVLAGALVSVLFNNIFPVSLAKRRTRRAAGDCENAIRDCAAISTTLRSALFAEAARLRLLNGSFSWYSTTKGEQIEQVRTQLKALQDCVAAAQSISNQRGMSEAAGPIPIRLRLLIEERLSTAETCLVDRKLDAAKAKVDEAAALLNSASIDNLATLRTDLMRDVEKLLAVAGSDDKRPEYITDLVKKLEANKQIAENIDRMDLLELERDHYIARTFICDYEKNRKPGSSLEQFGTEFLSKLRDDTTSTTTRLLVSLIQQELAPADVAKAIADGKAQIEAAGAIQPYQMGDFRFVFQGRLKTIVAARRLCTYDWNFNDGTVAPQSDFCRHFFLAARHYGLFGRLRDWWEAVVRWVTGRKRPVTPLKIMVTVTPPLNAGPATTIDKEIVLLPEQDHGFGAIGIEVATFFVSFVMAVFAAFGTQYATMPTADSLSVFITAFLFGFGLDQIRDKTTTAAAAH